MRFVWGWSQALDAVKAQNQTGVEKALLQAGFRTAQQEGNKLDEAELRYRLGQVHAYLGQKAEAEKEFESALEAFPMGATGNAILKEKRDLIALSEADREAIQGISIRIASGDPANSSVSMDSARIAIRGYDTVAYFAKGRPRLGFPRYYSIWRGAVWFFESAENQRKFAENPEHFAPTYGGFCAKCLVDGHKGSQHTGILARLRRPFIPSHKLGCSP